jgi:serine/threonine-protein kinase
MGGAVSTSVAKKAVVRPRSCKAMETSTCDRADMMGIRIGNYTIVEKIGEGGMGTVYRAAHATLGRFAAVKMLSPAGSRDAEMVARLFNEARSATAIRHPGVIEVYDVGMLPDRTAYIIMELLEGESLAARLRRDGGMAHHQALAIVRAVCRTLHAAHELGIIHRDLKPENIFLVPDPEMATGVRVKLLDFGIAKGAAPLRGLTETGMVMGTPPYMSPEQCRGAAVIDCRADLYALGCVLYELLCGEPPFGGGSAGEVIAHHLYFRPKPPRVHDAHIPPALEALVLWLLQKNPDRRPATAAHVVAALDDVATSIGTLSQRDALCRNRPNMDTEPTLTVGAELPEVRPAARDHERARRGRCNHAMRTARIGCRSTRRSDRR